MTAGGPDPRPLQAAIDGALALLDAHGAKGRARPGDAAPLPSLLDQARALRDAAEAGTDPIRMIHHFACTGGTVICKCLAALPNTRMVGETDPLTPLGFGPRDPVRFTPTDLIAPLRRGPRPVSAGRVIELFQAQLGALLAQCSRNGERLILRAHSHSQYCSGEGLPERRSLQAIAADVAPVRAVLTVRHPMASYQSLLSNDWEHFTPGGLDAYAHRYMAFLDDHAELPRLTYETFAADPETAIRTLCAALELPYRPGTPDLIEAVRLSGDSGRRGGVIRPRPPRPVPPALAAAAEASAAYRGLCDRLGYDPDPARSCGNAASVAPPEGSKGFSKGPDTV